ncbi:MAG: phage tail sheath subtilisin-like domain-containing protein [Phycisphaerales bacterium]
MSAFSVTDLMPGVYIDEVQVAGAIAGVATSNVSILGPALRQDSEINSPTLVTNLTQFNQEFGTIVDGNPEDHVDGFFASHAVHGFFRNGGTTCYYVRVSNAARAERALLDTTAANVSLIVRALALGPAGALPTVEVQNANIVTVADNVTAIQATANLVGAGAALNQAEVDNASVFRAHDELLVDDGGGTSERITVLRTDTAANTIDFTANLINAYAAGGTVRIADLEVGQERFRVSDIDGIEPGSYVNIDNGADNENLVVSAVDVTNNIVTFEEPGLTNVNEYGMSAGDPAVVLQTLEFTLVVTPQSGPVETYANLSLETRHSRYFRTAVNSATVEALEPTQTNTSTRPTNLPDVLPAAPLLGGADEDLDTLSSADYQRAIDALESVDEVNLLCVPDRVDMAVQSAMIGHCERMQDRFAILDPQPGADPATIRAQRDALGSDRGFAAIYYPRIQIADPDPDAEDGARITVPPSGHIAGVFALVDKKEGVHVAPANKKLRNVLGLERTLSETDAGLLNEQSVNILRFARGRGHLIWGARTIATGTQWRYTNVRRFVLYIEESIQEAVEASVFRPNNLALWETIKRQVTNFLTQEWASGALYGREPAEGFTVRVDEELNPPDQMALGILTVEVRLRPNPPAEFIVFRIIADTGTSLVEE